MGNTGDHDRRDEPGELQKEVIAYEQAQPQEHNDTRRVAVNDIPHNQRQNHGDNGAARAADEAKQGLPRGHGHTNGYHDHGPDETLLPEKGLGVFEVGDDANGHGGASDAEAESGFF